MMKLIVAFRKIFANGPKNHYIRGKGRFVSVHSMR